MEKNSNKDYKVTDCNNKSSVGAKLCYVSIVALFLAIFALITPSGVRDLIALNAVTSVIAIVSLIRIRISNGKLRGKGFAIVAFSISLVYMLFLIAVLILKGK